MSSVCFCGHAMCSAVTYAEAACTFCSTCLRARLSAAEAERDTFKVRVDSAESASRGHAFAFDQACQRAEAAEARVKELDAERERLVGLWSGHEGLMESLKERLDRYRGERDAARAQVEAMRAALEREVMRPAMDRQFCTLCRREVTGFRAVELFEHAPNCVLALSVSVPAQEPKHCDCGAAASVEGWHTPTCNDAQERQVERTDQQLREACPDCSVTGRASATWPFVLAFARRMETKLEMNRHKGDREGWLGMSAHALLKRLGEEVLELVDACTQRGPGTINAQCVIDEAADVANFAMMIADIADPTALVKGAAK